LGPLINDRDVDWPNRNRNYEAADAAHNPSQDQRSEFLHGRSAARGSDAASRCPEHRVCCTEDSTVTYGWAQRWGISSASRMMLDRPLEKRVRLSLRDLNHS